jgi:hypothetical protein
MKNIIFWDVTSCRSCKNGHFEGTYCLHHQGDIKFLRNVLQLLVTVNVIPSSPILVILMMEAISSFETSVLATATRLKIPEDGILHQDN